MFNSHVTGKLDGVSMPICKATAGSERRDCRRGIEITRFLPCANVPHLYNEINRVVLSTFSRSPCLLTGTGGFLVHLPDESCTSATVLSSIKDCSSAKTVLDPGADAVKSENNRNAPKGCSRHKGAWYFNTVVAGKLDGESEPICKALPGKNKRLRIKIAGDAHCL